MTTRSSLGFFFKGAGLILLYAVLFAGGAALFPIPDTLKLTPEQQQQSSAALVLVSIIDTMILGAIASTSRLRGWRLYAMLATVFWGVKTFTSQLEALWFMPNVTRGMAPMLLAMTLPLAVIFPAVLMAALGLWRRMPALEPAWREPAMGRGEFALKLGLLCVVVYPVLFFAFGYFVAWQSEAVREFYGGAVEGGVVAHFKSLFSNEPQIWAFESLRGLLWVAFALPILRTTRGPAWLGTALVALLFCFVQNDVHLIPNPLMAPAVQRAHFIETGSSNVLWALAIGALLSRSHRRGQAAASGA